MSKPPAVDTGGADSPSRRGDSYDALVARLTGDVDAGRWADFDPDRPTIIPADLVATLVVAGRAPHGVRIRGARIGGAIDLSDARSESGGACNALILEDCEILGTGDGSHGTRPAIDASHGHLRRLSLVRCRLDGLELSDAIVDGELNLDGVRGREADGNSGTCWVKARDSRIGGTVTARRANLSLPWPAPAEWHPDAAGCWSEVRAPFALDLQGACISGSLVLQPDFTAKGGVNIAHATIAGTLWAQGAQVTKAGVGQNSVEALRAQSAEIHGHVILDCAADGPAGGGRGGVPDDSETLKPKAKRFEAVGKIDFYSAKIGGNLWLRGAKVDPDGVDVALELYAASVAVDVFLDREEQAGLACEIPAIGLITASVGGNLWIDTQGTIRQIHGAGLRVTGDLDLRGSVADTTDLSGAIVDRNMTIVSADGPDAEPPGELTLTTATVGGALLIDSEAGIPHIEAAGLRVNGAAQIRGLVVTVDVSDAAIGSDLAIIGGRVEKIAAHGLRVHGTLSLAGLVTGSSDFSGSEIAGDLMLGPGLGIAVFLEPKTAAESPAIKLTGSTVGRSLEVGRLLDLPPAFPLDLVEAPHRLRTAPLRTHPGWHVAEAWFASDGTEHAAVLTFLYRPDGRDGVYVLNGQSARIHRFNEEQRLVLATEEQVEQYLTLFCNNTWAGEGAFVVERESVTVAASDHAFAAEAAPELGRAPLPGSWQATAEVEYGDARYGARFLVEPDGNVVMVEDDPCGPAEGQPIAYYAPLRWVGSSVENGDWAVAPPSAFEFTPISVGDLGPQWSKLQAQLRADVEASAPEIDLRGLKAGSLSDGFSSNWGLGESSRFRPKDLRHPVAWRRNAREARQERDRRWARGPAVRLRLSGFEYSRIDDPAAESDPFARPDLAAPPTAKKAIGFRDRWLQAQYARDVPTEDEYRPEPYQQLAKVLRSAGEFDAADKVTYERLKLEKVHLRAASDSSRWRSLLRILRQRLLWRPFVQWPFGFGLKPFRAACVFLAFWLAGVGALYALSGDFKIDDSAVGAVVAIQGQTKRVVVPDTKVSTSQSAIACGSHVSKLLYPLDVMIPFVDLREEPRCRFSGSGLTFMTGVYAIVGWLLTSGVVFTLSGIVRRRLEA
jgi:hypothetical protein